MKVSPVWVLILVMAGYIGWKELRPEASVAPSPAVTDATVVELGQRYRTAFDAAGLAGLDAGANASVGTTADLIRAQADALDAAVKQSSQPVVAEIKRRFLDPSTASIELVRAFNRDLAAGWRKGAR